MGGRQKRTPKNPKTGKVNGLKSREGQGEKWPQDHDPKNPVNLVKSPIHGKKDKGKENGRPA